MVVTQKWGTRYKIGLVVVAMLVIIATVVGVVATKNGGSDTPLQGNSYARIFGSNVDKNHDDMQRKKKSNFTVHIQSSKSKFIGKDLVQKQISRAIFQRIVPGCP